MLVYIVLPVLTKLANPGHVRRWEDSVFLLLAKSKEEAEERIVKHHPDLKGSLEVRLLHNYLLENDYIVEVTLGEFNR